MNPRSPFVWLKHVTVSDGVTESKSVFVAHVTLNRTLGSVVLYYIVVIWCATRSLGAHAVLKCLSNNIFTSYLHR